MNRELEKLLDLTLVDGYISDKEREVLKRKAMKLGLAEGEVDIYIDAKLYEINIKNGTAKKEEKCPACGEVVSANDTVCPSCDYDLKVIPGKNAQYKSNTDVDLNYSKKIDQDLSNYERIVKKGGFSHIWSTLKIIFTGGLYIVYKKLILGGVIFDSFEKESTALITKAKIYETYLVSKNIDSTLTTHSLSDAEKTVRKQKISDIAPTFFWLLMLFGVPYGWFYLMMLPNKEITKSDNKQSYEFTIIDSLINDNNYIKVTDIATAIPDNEFDEHIDSLLIIALKDKSFNTAEKLADIMRNSKLAHKRIRLAKTLSQYN